MLIENVSMYVSKTWVWLEMDNNACCNYNMYVIYGCTFTQFPNCYYGRDLDDLTNMLLHADGFQNCFSPLKKQISKLTIRLDILPVW